MKIILYLLHPKRARASENCVCVAASKFQFNLFVWRCVQTCVSYHLYTFFSCKLNLFNKSTPFLFSIRYLLLLGGSNNASLKRQTIWGEFRSCTNFFFVHFVCTGHVSTTNASISTAFQTNRSTVQFGIWSTSVVKRRASLGNELPKISIHLWHIQFQKPLEYRGNRR